MVAHERGDVGAQALAGAQALQHRARELGAARVVAEERDATVGAHGAGERLGGVVQQRAPAQRLAACELVRERLGQQRRDRLSELGGAENGGRIGLQRDRALEHLERVAVDVAVVVAALLYAAQGIQLRQHGRGDPERVHQLQALERTRGGEDATQLHEHALAGDVPQLGRGARGRVRGVGVGLEAEIERKPHEAQDAQGIVGERARRGHAQAPRGEIGQPSERVVDRLASGDRLGDRVDVKSRSARSAASEPPRSGWTSTCQERSRATTRQPEKSSESSKQAAPPAAARAIARAAVSGEASRTMSRSNVSRPSARSRGAPPTSQAGVSASAARTRAAPPQAPSRSRRRRGGGTVCAPYPRGQPAGDLVVDRVDASAPAPPR